MANIDYNELMLIIQRELVEFINLPDNYEIYKDYKLVVSLEQQFMKLKDKDPNAIYIVVKFSSSSVFFGQTAVPFNMIVLSEENKFEIAQKLMEGFAEMYNLGRTNDNTIQQIFDTPTVSGNFNPIYAGYRSVVRTRGTFVITKNAAYYELYYTWTENGVKYEQKIPTIATSFSLVNQPDTQPFYNTHDFVKSVVRFGAFSLNFSTFLLNDNALVNKILDITTGAHTSTNYDAAADSWEPDVKKQYNSDGKLEVVKDYSSTVNDTFNIEVRFFDGRTRSCEMKLSNCQVTEKIGEIPALVLAFTE